MKMNSLTAAMMLVVLLALTCLAGCGDGNSEAVNGAAFQMEYLDTGFPITADATGKAGAVIGQRVFIQPGIMYTQGGPATSPRVEIKDLAGHLLPPVDKETWVFPEPMYYDLRLMEGNTVRATLRILAVRPFSEPGGQRLEVRMNGYTQPRTAQGFVVLDADEEMTMNVEGAAEYRVIDVNSHTVSRGQRWETSLGFYCLQARTSAGWVNQWAYVVYGRG